MKWVLSTLLFTKCHKDPTYYIVCECMCNCKAHISLSAPTFIPRTDHCNQTLKLHICCIYLNVWLLSWNSSKNFLGVLMCNWNLQMDISINTVGGSFCVWSLKEMPRPFFKDLLIKSCWFYILFKNWNTSDTFPQTMLMSSSWSTLPGWIQGQMLASNPSVTKGSPNFCHFSPST